MAEEDGIKSADGDGLSRPTSLVRDIFDGNVASFGRSKYKKSVISRWVKIYCNDIFVNFGKAQIYHHNKFMNSGNPEFISTINF